MSVFSGNGNKEIPMVIHLNGSSRDGRQINVRVKLKPSEIRLPEVKSASAQPNW